MVAVAALVNRPLTSLIWLKKSGIKGVGGLQGQDRRHRRHPLPGGLPEDDPRPRPTLPRRRQGSQRRLRPAAGPARRQRPGDARRLQQRRGRRPARARQGPGRHPGRQARRAHLRRAGPRRQPQLAGSRPGKVPSLHRRPAARHRSGRGTAERRHRGGARSQRRTRTEADRSRGRRRRCRCSAGRTAGKPYGYMDPAEWRDLRRLDARQRPDQGAADARPNCSATPTCRARSPNSRAPLRRAAG